MSGQEGAFGESDYGVERCTDMPLYRLEFTALMGYIMSPDSPLHKNNI
jgi:hypothetical protein